MDKTAEEILWKNHSREVSHKCVHEDTAYRAMRDYHQSRLSELQERVEGLRSFGKLESMNDIAVSKKQILNLIKEMRS